MQRTQRAHPGVVAAVVQPHSIRHGLVRQHASKYDGHIHSKNVAFNVHCASNGQWRGPGRIVGHWLQLHPAGSHQIVPPQRVDHSVRPHQAARALESAKHKQLQLLHAIAGEHALPVHASGARRLRCSVVPHVHIDLCTDAAGHHEQQQQQHCGNRQRRCHAWAECDEKFCVCPHAHLRARVPVTELADLSAAQGNTKLSR